MRISKPSLVLPLLLLLGCPEDGADDGAADGGVMQYCETCDLDHWVPALAAEGAVDCGTLELGEDATGIAACVEDALDSGTPFTARQWLQGIDSLVAVGWLVDHDGVVQQLTWDSNICGSPLCEEGCGPTVSTMECVSPRVGAVPEQALVDCDAGAWATLCEPPAVE
jgi:hypothetical protein